MERTITVRGTGHVRLKPDLTVIELTVRTRNKSYDRSMEEASELLSKLREAISGSGFGEKDLKTTGFNVCSEYESEVDRNGNYKQKFAGYACIHTLKLEFDFDTKRLSRALGAVASCLAEPELAVRFTVRDREAATRELLRSAAENARLRAGILTEASGVKLGELLTIDYNWGKINVYSNTRFNTEAKCMALGAAADMDIEPEDIDLTDSAAFTWEIK